MIKKILIGIVCLLVFPNIGNAAGSCIGARIDAKITNSNGAQTYDENGSKQEKVLNYGEKYEYCVYTHENSTSEYIEISNNNESFFVKKEDITLQEIDYKLVEKKSGQVYVYKEGAKLYKGPSIYYEEIENINIPVGTTLTYEYIYYGEAWKYVEYNGKKGWIPTNWHIEATAANVKKGSIISDGDITLFKNPSPDFTLTQKIEVPANTIINYNVFYDGYDGGAPTDFYYIEYNGYKGWIRPVYGFMGAKTDFGEPGQQMYITLDSVELFDYIGSDNVISVIPSGEKIESKYVYAADFSPLSRWIYIEYNGKKGWIVNNINKVSSFYDFSKGFTLNEIPLSKEKGGNDIQYTINKYEEIEYKYISPYYYIEQGNKKGWFLYEDNKNIIFGPGKDCIQYLVLNKDGEKLTSLTGEEIIVPYNTVLKVLYKEYNQGSIVEYKGEKYFLSKNANVLESDDISKSTYYAKNNGDTLKVYNNKVLSSSEISFEIKDKELFNVLFESDNASYISYNGKQGWVNSKEVRFLYYLDEDDRCFFIDNLDAIDKDNLEENENDKTSNKIDSKIIIIVSIVSTFVAIIIGLILIKSINKKNKNIEQ